MSHEPGGHAVRPEERLFERKNDGQGPDRVAQPVRASRRPGPRLRRDVVEHGDVGGGRGAGDLQVEARVVHQNHEVITPFPKPPSQPAEERDVDQQSRQRFGEPHGGERLDPLEEAYAGVRHPLAAHALDLQVTPLLTQRRGEGSGMSIARGLPGTDAHAERRRGSHTSTPRCELTTKSTSRITSGTSGLSSRRRSTASLRLKLELNRSRYACWSAARTSRGKPARTSARELMP